MSASASAAHPEIFQALVAAVKANDVEKANEILSDKSDDELRDLLLQQSSEDQVEYYIIAKSVS